MAAQSVFDSRQSGRRFSAQSRDRLQRARTGGRWCVRAIHYVLATEQGRSTICANAERSEPKLQAPPTRVCPTLTRHLLTLNGPNEIPRMFTSSLGTGVKPHPALAVGLSEMT